MQPDAEEESRAIFTAGFSNLSLDRFLDNMRAYEIQVLVDVRSKPFASYTPHFNKDSIKAAALAAGFGYRYMGRELGGLPDNPVFYDDAGHVLYDRIAAQPWFEQGIENVLFDLRRGKRLALTCGEDDPRHCHRRLLVGRVLRERGIGVAHILANGGLIAEAELLDAERRIPRQLTLFGGVQEPEWKSTWPALRDDRHGERRDDSGDN
ncbi:MAG: DUF488 domain-containing protein [Humidesulfovibrio sp.]|nr:DUF488 domain-containing protein [Humidesulfovibrio sp.]